MDWRQSSLHGLALDKWFSSNWFVKFFIFFLILCIMSSYTASLHKLAAGRKLATTHLNVSNRQMCGCTGFKSGSYKL